MRLKWFQVKNYRNIHDSGPIDVEDVTAFVGQNEAGKSNLFEALYRINPFKPDIKFDIDEDWPVDLFGEKATGSKAKVCEATFALETEEISSLYDAAAPKAEPPAEGAPPAGAPHASRGSECHRLKVL